MRALIYVLPVVLLMAMLAACSVSREDDDSVAADATETPVMDSQQTDDSDDAVSDDAEATDDSADDSVSDDSATDDADATDDATDDASDDATDDATDDAAIEEDEEEAPEPVEHTIDLVDGNEFSPAEITIAPGDTITWTNLTDQVHTVSADPDIATDPSHVELPEGAEPWHSGSLDPDESFSITLDVPGTYTYFCYPHQDAGMIGTIIVEGPDPESDDPSDAESDDPSDVDSDDPADTESDDSADVESDDPSGVDTDDDYESADDADDSDTTDAAAPTPAPTQPQYSGKDATN